MRTDATPDLGDLEAVRSLWAAGAGRFPELAVPLPLFVKYLEERRPSGPDGAAFLHSLGGHAADLYLACGCVHSLPGALAAFEDTQVSQVPLFVSRLALSPEQIAEVKQRVREKLFLAGTNGRRPRIADYGGQGALTGWMRAVTVCTAISLLRRRADQPLREEQLDARVLEDAPDPEVEYLRVRYQSEFREAIQTALRGLSSEQRNLLRMHTLDGLSIDKLGALFQVHRATVARRLQDARAEVLAQTRRQLQERLGVSPAELDSMIRAVRSRLNVSLAGCLGPGAAGPKA